MIPLVKPYIAPKEEMLPAIENVLYSGYIAEGEYVYSFEHEFGKYIDNPLVLALNSGTAALHLALLCIGVGAGDEVISTAMTAEPTNTTIAITGAKVVWADVDENTGLISPESIEEKITTKTKAIMVVHYAGMVCDMEKINAISQKYDIPVIEDTAHALGSRFNNKIIGSNSRFTCFSFQAIKQMTTVDGGAISFKYESDLNFARKLRWFGLDKKVSRLENDITKAGYKYGMNNVTAAIGSTQLTHQKEIINRYIKNGKYYDSALLGIPGITLVPYYSHTEPSYWLYTMKVENREDFIKMLADISVIASPLHHRSDTHSVFSASKCNLPGLNSWYKSFVHIPCGWWVSDDERQMIVDAIKKGW